MSIACVCGHGIRCPIHPDIPAHTSAVPYADPSAPIEVLDAEWERAVQLTEVHRAAQRSTPELLRSLDDALLEGIEKKAAEPPEPPPESIRDLKRVPFDTAPSLRFSQAVADTFGVTPAELERAAATEARSPD